MTTESIKIEVSDADEEYSYLIVNYEIDDKTVRVSAKVKREVSAKWIKDIKFLLEDAKKI